jgi:hypothetical protein
MLYFWLLIGSLNPSPATPVSEPTITVPTVLVASMPQSWSDFPRPRSSPLVPARARPKARWGLAALPPQRSSIFNRLGIEFLDVTGYSVPLLEFPSRRCLCDRVAARSERCAGRDSKVCVMVRRRAAERPTAQGLKHVMISAGRHAERAIVCMQSSWH